MDIMSHSSVAAINSCLSKFQHLLTQRAFNRPRRSPSVQTNNQRAFQLAAMVVVAAKFHSDLIQRFLWGPYLSLAEEGFNGV